MKIIARLVAIAVLGLPVFAAPPDMPGFAEWRVAELQQRDNALSKKVGPDHSARETLADYGDHRFRYIYRDADGFPEQHENIVDIVIGEWGMHAAARRQDDQSEGQQRRRRVDGHRHRGRRASSRRCRRHRPDSRKGPAQLPCGQGKTLHVRAAEDPGQRLMGHGRACLAGRGRMPLGGRM